MSAESKPHEPPTKNSALPRRTRRRYYFPPIWVWVVALLCLGLIVILQVRAETLDHAMVNIVTLILCFLAVLAGTIWFLFFSAYHWLFRILAVAWSLFTVVVLGYLFLDFTRVRGDLLPGVRFRFAKRPDELLAKATGDQGASKVDLAKTSSDDFPEFLGPDRAAWIEGDSLGYATDWKENPPHKLWRQPIGAGWSPFSAANGVAVTLEQRGEDELVTCYEARTGKLVWSHSGKARHANAMGGIGPRSAATIHDGKVYALGATGLLHCLDGATGRPVWESKDLLALCGSSPAQDQTRVMWGRSGSPLIVDDLVVVPFGGKPTGPHKSLIAFNKQTGEEVWRGGDRQVGYASPTLTTLCGVRQILSVNENNVSGHDPQTGKVLWQHDWPGTSNGDANASQAVPLPPDRFLLSKAYGSGAALVKLSRDASGQWTSEREWHNKTVLKTKFTNVAVGVTAIFALSDGVLECVDLETGRRNWKKGHYGQGQILGVGSKTPLQGEAGLIFVQGESGEVVLCEADPENHVELTRFQAIEGVTWNNLCLHGRLLLVRNSDEAACYELAPAPPPPPPTKLGGGKPTLE